MGSRLISTNGKGLEDYISKLKKMQKDAVTVGIHKSAGNHDNSDLTVAEVAAYNEFGTERSPERSFMRSTMRENRFKYRLNVIRIIKAIGDGKDPRKMMGLFGQQVQQDIQRKIVELKTPPNAQSTIDRKKSSNPLIDTGQMVSSVRWEYVNNAAD